MKRLKYLLFMILLMPVVVSAQTYTYNICKSGCEYNKFIDIVTNIYNLPADSNLEIIINFQDSETYQENNNLEIYNDNNPFTSVTINGNNATIINEEYLFAVERAKTATIKDLNVTAADISLEGEKYATNFTELAQKINNKELYNNKYTLNNINFEGSELVIFGAGTFEVTKGVFSGPFAANNAKLLLNKSTINNALMAGSQYPNSEIYIFSDNILPNKISRLKVGEETASQIDDLQNKLKQNSLIEMEVTPSLYNYGISRDANNVLYYYQEKNKTIKEDTNISEIEKEFVNTYEDSYGYDDIKDDAIVWTSTDESIVKIENGIVKVLKSGNVDLTANKGNDYYTMHLTVEKPTIAEKITNTIEKKTIKVPITGKEVKAWIIVVSVVLLAVIGISTSMLIKRKK